MANKRVTRISRTESDEMVAQPKLIAEALQWRPEHSSYRLSATVAFAPSAARLELLALRGYVGRCNFSFALLYANNPLRKYTKHSPHRIGGIRYTDPHKHVWDGRTELRIAYVPDDIDAGAPVGEQFLQFCHECNIEIIGHYAAPMFDLK